MQWLCKVLRTRRCHFDTWLPDKCRPGRHKRARAESVRLRSVIAVESNSTPESNKGNVPKGKNTYARPFVKEVVSPRQSCFTLLKTEVMECFSIPIHHETLLMTTANGSLLEWFLTYTGGAIIGRDMIPQGGVYGTSCTLHFLLLFSRYVSKTKSAEYTWATKEACKFNTCYQHQ